jgi:hypothetical protein
VATLHGRLGHDIGAGALSARYAAVLGADHPDLLLFAQEELIDIDFTPLPL